MTEKTKLRKYFPYRINELDAVKEYLEEMALKGWKLTDFSHYLLFEKIEPQKLIYSVEVFDDASDYDYEPDKDTQEYIEYCAEAGWEYVSCSGKIIVFVAKDENCIPIETDEKFKFKIISKSLLKHIVFTGLYLLMYSAFIIVGWNTVGYYKLFTSNVFLLFTLILCITFLEFAGLVISFLPWYIKMRMRLVKGEPLKYLSRVDLKNKSWLRNIPWVLLGSLLLLIGVAAFLNKDYTTAIRILIILGGAAAIERLSDYIDNRKISNNRVVIPQVLAAGIFILSLASFIAAPFVIEKRHVEPPLRPQDFGIAEMQSVKSDSDVSITVFAKDTSFVFSPKESSFLLVYDVLESKYPWIIKKCADSKLDNNFLYTHYKRADIPSWGAESVYVAADGSSGAIVVYKDRIFTYHYSSDNPMTDKVIEVIVKKLDLK